MFNASYEVIVLDLTVARDRLPIVSQGNRIRAVMLNDLSAAGNILLHVGGSGRGFKLKDNRPVRFPGKSFDGTLLVSHAAQAGVLAEIVVVYDDANQAVEAFTIGGVT